MPKAYPAYFGAYGKFSMIRSFVDGFDNLFLIGRNGMHRYNNQDHSMITAMTAVENIVRGISSKENIWQVEQRGAMKISIQVPRIKMDLMMAMGSYLILGAILLNFYQYQINPDGISYISIAQKYLRGDYGNAVNGYWSPLFSWLLMPFLLLGCLPYIQRNFFLLG